MFVAVNFDALAHASDFRIERRQVVSFAECRIRSWEVWDTKSPADWMPTRKPIELSMIRRKTWTQQPIPIRWVNIQPTWLNCRLAFTTGMALAGHVLNWKEASCLPLLRPRFELGRLRHPLASRLNARSQTDWAAQGQAIAWSNENLLLIGPGI